MVEVVWSEQAIRNRNKIFAYWNQRNGSNTYSKKLRVFIQLAIAIIQYFPEVGKPTNIPNIRIKIIEHYFLIYQLKERQIRILDFWDSRQNPIKIL
jgi:toxin YoeB